MAHGACMHPGSHRRLDPAWRSACMALALVQRTTQVPQPHPLTRRHPARAFCFVLLPCARCFHAAWPFAAWRGVRSRAALCHQEDQSRPSRVRRLAGHRRRPRCALRGYQRIANITCHSMQTACHFMQTVVIAEPCEATAGWRYPLAREEWGGRGRGRQQGLACACAVRGSAAHHWQPPAAQWQRRW